MNLHKNSYNSEMKDKLFSFQNFLTLFPNVIVKFTIIYYKVRKFLIERIFRKTFDSSSLSICGGVPKISRCVVAVKFYVEMRNRRKEYRILRFCSKRKMETE